MLGLSGMAVYLPSYRVQLRHWCDWTGNSWDKTRAVVGSGFRMRGADENAYTMAATAVLRLIDRYDIDPGQIGFLGLGTESSTDNSAGAVIVRGMLDHALVGRGLAPISRACEVPEFKHACLGGFYAMKAAARYLATDGADRLAIVVCSDVAEYERFSSGEPTQGAGAVAMLLEPRARLLEIELGLSGSSSAYRGLDFRKPLSRFMGQTGSDFLQPRDFPIFNGKYSTTCYLDAVLSAFRDFYLRLDAAPSAFFDEVAMTFLHRPYQRMAESGLAFAYLLGLALGADDDRARLGALAARVDVSLDALIEELTGARDLQQLVDEGNVSTDLFPLTSAVARGFRESPEFAAITTSFGTERMQDVGNLYTAALPAWMAAALDEAAGTDYDLAGRRVLSVGYGSGDAAEVMVMRGAPDWRDAARRIEFAAALHHVRDLDAEAYGALHEGRLCGPRVAQPGVFYIDSVGDGAAEFDDRGIEYYRLQT